MAFVIDASLAAAWFLLDEATPVTDALRLAAPGGAVALAIETKLPLATLDRKLAEAAKAEGVGILGPLAVSPIAP